MAPATRQRDNQQQSSKRQRQLEPLAAPKPAKRARKLTKNAASSPCGTIKADDEEERCQHGAQHGDRQVQNSSQDVRCRTAEVVSLRATLRAALQQRQGECIYIPGQPGTGKTHTVTSVLQSLECASWHATPAATLINCMDGQTASLGRSVLAGLVDSAERARSKPASAGITLSWRSISSKQQQLPDGHDARSNADALAVLRRVATGTLAIGKGMCIVVLDELDQACKKADVFVKELFKLPKLPNSQLIIIGIANRMDLTERLLKGTDLHASQRPKMISFHSYSARQLLDLLQARYPDKFASKALELVARRISAASGDMRAAIAACDTAVSRCSRRLQAARADAQNDETGGAASHFVTVAEVAEALKTCGSGASAQASNQVAAIQELPAQQQLLLCTLAIARGSVAKAAAASPLQPLQASPLVQQPLAAHFRACSGLARSSAANASRSLLKTPQSQTKSPHGFGLGVALGACPAVNKAFPRADDEMLVTPDTAPATPKGAAGQHRAAPSPSAAQKSDLPMQAVYNKYKAAAKEAGFAALDMSQLQAMVSALQGCGLLASRRAIGAKQGSTRLSLAVSTDDVKHALHDNRLMQALVKQLP